MACCRMTSAASGSLVTPNITSNTSTVKCTMLMFSSKNTRCSRLVVKAAEDQVAPPTATTTPSMEANPKPRLIGPKRGTKVRILKKESYWYDSVGSVVTVDQDPNTCYPVDVQEIEFT